MWKEWLNRYNPYNPMKALYWQKRLEQIAQGEIPVPITVWVDPANLCQANCFWCQFREYRRTKPVTMTASVLLSLPKSLEEWGVEGVVVGGAGEPLMHPKIVEFLEALKQTRLSVALETNGIKLRDEKIRAAVIDSCSWVRISLDAATPRTYLKVKKALVGSFQKVLDGVGLLVRERNGKCPKITLTFLIHHTNYGEMYQFADMAKSFKVDEVHFRPVYLRNYRFTSGLRGTSEWHLRESRKELEGDDFHIYGIVHKFDREWQRAIRFKQCYATPLVGAFGADQIFYMCPDRRGDDLLNLGKFHPFEKFLARWGSDEHKDKISRISPPACPRCTQCITNEIIERVVLKGEMMLKFV